MESRIDWVEPVESATSDRYQVEFSLGDDNLVVYRDLSEDVGQVISDIFNVGASFGSNNSTLKWGYDYDVGLLQGHGIYSKRMDNPKLD